MWYLLTHDFAALFSVVVLCGFPLLCILSFASWQFSKLSEREKTDAAMM